MMDFCMKSSTFLAFLLLTASIKAIPSGEIHGSIRDLETKQSIEYAAIALYKMTDSSLVNGTISNIDGTFIIKNIHDGNYFLKFSCLGFQEKRIENISITENKRIIYLNDIYMQKLAEYIDAVVVNAERRSIEYRIDKDILNVEHQANSADGMVSEILNNHPAVETSADGSIKLRGSANFMVLIDGKPIPEQGPDILNQIPSAGIEKIEIITNPSAKYDANHAAGIVNLITRKNKLTGLSGAYNGAISNAERYNGNIMLNYRTKKVNYYIQSDLYHSPVFQDRTSEEDRIVNGSDGFQNFHSDNILLWEGKSINTGIDFYAGNRNTLSLFLSKNTSVYGWSPQKTITEGTKSDTNFYILDDHMRNHRDAWHINISDIHRFSENGHEISFDINVIAVDMSRRNDQYLFSSDKTLIFTELAEEYHLKRHQNIIRQQYRMDYSLPLHNKGSIETGLMIKLDNRTIENNINTLIHEDRLLNNDKYDTDNNLLAFYSTFLYKVMKSDLQLGLRFEYAKRNTILTNGDFSKTFSRFDFFPSINLSHRFSNNHSIRLGYSRSIWRPTDLQINPTVYFRDISGEFSGNAGLRPSYNNAVELSYNLPFGKHSFSVTAFYRYTKSNIMTIRYLFGDSVYRNNPENLMGGQRDIGIEFSGNLDCFKWLTLNPGGNFYNGDIHGDVTNQVIDRRSNIWSLRLITTIKPFKQTRIVLNAYYNSPTLGDQVSMAEIYSLSFSVRHEIFKSKISLSISGDDIFQTEKRKFTVEGDNFRQQITDIYPKHPIISLGISLKLNNIAGKQRENIEEGIGFN